MVHLYFYSDPSATTKEKIKVIVEPFLFMMPKILKQIGMFDHLIKAREEEPLDKVPK